MELADYLLVSSRRRRRLSNIGDAVYELIPISGGPSQVVRIGVVLHITLAHEAYFTSSGGSGPRRIALYANSNVEEGWRNPTRTMRDSPTSVAVVVALTDAVPAP